MSADLLLIARSLIGAMFEQRSILKMAASRAHHITAAGLLVRIASGVKGPVASCCCSAGPLGCCVPALNVHI